jgi:NitT/TauT family transport system substrate-binding protein
LRLDAGSLLPAAWLSWFRGLALAGSALIAAACQPRIQELTVPISAWPPYEYVYLAQQKGLARARGLLLDTPQFPDPQSMVHAYLRGELQLVQLTTVEVVDVCARAPERCPVVVLVVNESRGGDQVVARPGIETIAQLRGRRVGVAFSTLGPYVLSRALAQAGLGLADVDLVSMAMAAMPQALSDGRLDAAALFPPFSEFVVRDGSARRLFDSRAIPGEVFDVLAVNPRVFQQDQAALVRLVRAWQDAHDLAEAEPEAAQTLMGRRQGLSPEEFARAETGVIYFGLRDQLALLAPGGVLERNLETVRRVQEQLQLLGSSSPLPEVSDAIVKAALR